MPYKVAEVIWKKDKIEFILGEPQKEEQKLLLYTEEEHPSFINFTQLAKIAKEKTFLTYTRSSKMAERRNE